MNTREWALVAFTLLLQTSVGVAMVIATLEILPCWRVSEGGTRSMHAPFAIAVLAAVLGLLVSLVHLGHPWAAWRALANIRTSWLSREVAAASVFVVVLAVAAALHWLAAPPAVRSAASATAALLGLVLVHAMTRLYMVPAQPGWNRLLTPAAFLASTLLLGVVAAWVAEPAAWAQLSGVSGHWGGLAHGRSPAAGEVQAVRLIMVLLVIGAIVALFQLSAITHEPAPAIASSAITLGAWLVVARVSAVAIAVALLALCASARTSASPAITLIVVVLVFVSELLGRVLFYASAVRMGLH